MLGFKPLRRVNDRPQLYGKQKDHRHAPLPCYSPTAAPHFGAPFSGALADARPLRPPPHQHTRSPVRARRRMAARMQLLAPLFLRRVHRNTPPRSAFCVDSSQFLSSAGVLFRAVARQPPRNSLVGRRHAARAERPTPGRASRGAVISRGSLSPRCISPGVGTRGRGVKLCYFCAGPSRRSGALDCRGHKSEKCERDRGSKPEHIGVRTESERYADRR